MSYIGGRNLFPLNEELRTRERGEGKDYENVNNPIDVVTSFGNHSSENE